MEPRVYKRPEYTDTEKNFRDLLIKLMERARDQREKPHDEFNGLTYSQWYTENAKNRNGFKPAKTNKNEVRITTGTVTEKTNSIVASLQNLNLKASIDAYDEKGGVVDQLGGLVEDLVKKSEELECPTFEEKELRIIDEFAAQGTVFTLEDTKEFTIPDKIIESMDIGELDKIVWKEGVEKFYRYCDTEELIGMDVYLGNIKEPYMQKQPFVFIRKLIPTEEAQAMFGKWSRWDNVPLTLTEFNSQGDDEISFNNWTLLKFDANYTEVIYFMDRWNNNFMKMVNGTLMFPVKEHKGRYSTIPLTALAGAKVYPVAKGDYEIIGHWAYSRCVPSKTITDAALFDEFLKSMVIKTRQSYDPPVSNETGAELSDDIFYPGTIWDDIDADKIKPLIQAGGVTPAEFSMTNFVKGLIDDKSVSPIFQGKESQNAQTATEASLQQRQSMKNMSLAVTGLVNYHKQRVMLRIYNILNTWTLPEKLKNGITQLNDEYKSLTIDTTIGGRKGKRIVKFTENLPNPRQAQAESRILTKVKGEKTQVDYANPIIMREAINYFWKISINPTLKTDSPLKVAQFQEFIKMMLPLSQALGFRLKGQNIGERMSVLNEEDPDKIIDATPMPQLPEGMAGMAGAGNPQGGPSAPAGMPAGGQVNKTMVPRTAPAPSVNTMARG